MCAIFFSVACPRPLMRRVRVSHINCYTLVSDVAETWSRKAWIALIREHDHVRLLGPYYLLRTAQRRHNCLRWMAKVRIQWIDDDWWLFREQKQQFCKKNMNAICESSQMWTPLVSTNLLLTIRLHGSVRVFSSLGHWTQMEIFIFCDAFWMVWTMGARKSPMTRLDFSNDYFTLSFVDDNCFSHENQKSRNKRRKKIESLFPHGARPACTKSHTTHSWWI